MLKQLVWIKDGQALCFCQLSRSTKCGFDDLIPESLVFRIRMKKRTKKIGKRRVGDSLPFPVGTKYGTLLLPQFPNPDHD